VTSVAFSSDNKYVVSGSRDKTVRIWNVETGLQKGTEFTGHPDWVTSVAFSSDSKYVVSGSDDKTVRIWDMEAGQEIDTEPQGHFQSPLPPSTKYSISTDGTAIRLYSPPDSNSSLLIDGWYYVHGHRYLWIPPLYREAIANSQFRCLPFNAEHPTLFINLEKFVHGPNWTSIMTLV
ncbi:WD40 repeat-like protein, partial [Pluteus cervinus]